MALAAEAGTRKPRPREPPALKSLRRAQCQARQLRL